MIGAFVAGRTLAENLAHFGSHQVTVGPVLNVDQLALDPHVRERGVLVDVPDPELGIVPMHEPTPRLSRTPGRIRRSAPALGEHQHLVDDSDPRPSEETP